MSKVKGGGGKKLGRNKVKCHLYEVRHKREKNKLRRLLKLVKNHPKDKVMLGAIERLQNHLG